MLDLTLALLEESTSSPPFTGEDFLRKLFPNFWSFLINFLALGVLFLCVFFLAYKPIKKFVQKRKEYIADNLKDSEESKAKYEGLLKDSDSVVIDAKKRADQIVKEAQADANAEALRIRENANDEASRRLKAADEEIKQARKKAQKDIRDEIVNVAMDASKAVLGREVNEEDDHRLVKDFIDDLKEGKR